MSRVQLHFYQALDNEPSPVARLLNFFSFQEKAYFCCTRIPQGESTQEDCVMITGVQKSGRGSKYFDTLPPYAPLCPPIPDLNQEHVKSEILINILKVWVELEKNVTS